jgi:methyl-accepting chemotaxis protein
MITQFVLSIVLCVGLTTIGFAVYYWTTFIAGDNPFREFIVVYRQEEEVQRVLVDGRMVDRRSYVSEALPDTTRWALILPPLLVNNAIISAVLVVLALRFSSRFAGPVYRMSLDIRRVLAGETSVRINLRRGDEMKDLAGRVNGLLDALELAEARAREG